MFKLKQDTSTANLDMLGITLHNGLVKWKKKKC